MYATRLLTTINKYKSKDIVIYVSTRLLTTINKYKSKDIVIYVCHSFVDDYK